MSTIFSGIQPSGNITLGNYLGAMQQFVSLQEAEDCYFCIANQNAITVPQDPNKLRQNTRSLAAMFMAIGLDPDKVTLFIQSEVTEHAQLAWIILTFSTVNELEQLTQFREKAKRYKDSVPAGLLAYPPFMVADILLYQTDYVPVGADQRENIKLTRQIAQKFNKQFGDVFTVPEMRTLKNGAHIGSLQNPDKKMSKSDPASNASIYLLDEPDVIREKIKLAQTDSENIVSYDRKKKSGISNLMTIYSLLTDQSYEGIQKDYAGKDYGIFKENLAEIIIKALDPIQERYKEIFESDYLDEVLTAGASKASQKAKETLNKVESVMGLVRNNSKV